MKTKNRTISLLIVLLIIVSIIPLSVQAAQKEPVVPMWTNVVSVGASITFSGTTGNVTVTFVGRPGVTNITSDIRLYYKNTSGSWVEILKDWEYDVDQMSLTVTESFAAVAGREYKIEVSGTVSKGGYAEPISKTATATCPRT